MRESLVKNQIAFSPSLVRSAMELIASGAGDMYVDASEEEKRLLAQDRFWQGPESNIALSGLQKVLTGSASAAGYPGIDLPAEFIAAGIAMMVRPCNQLGACTLLARNLVTVDEAVSGGQFADGFQCSPRALYAMVLQAYEWSPKFQEKMMKRLGLSLDKYLDLGKGEDTDKVRYRSKK